MQKNSFLAFLVEYKSEIDSVYEWKKITFTDWLNTVSTEELIEIAEIYGQKEFARGEMDWKTKYGEISIEDIPELKSLNR